MLERRRVNKLREICIIPTPKCYGGCKFCFLNRSTVGDRDWDKLYANIVELFATYDFDVHPVVRVFGGELFMDELLTPEYKESMKKMLRVVMRFIKDKGNCNFPISLENVSYKGVDFLKELRDELGVQILVPFSLDRLNKKGKEETYFKNLKRLGKVFRVGILVNDKNKFPDKYLNILKEHGEIYWEEPVMMDGFCWDYSDQMLPDVFQGVRCVSDNLRAVTSKGIFTCAGYTRRPTWIPEDEWDRLCNDEEYLDYGYQQVIDWYGCDTCSEQKTCPGMCWKSYYAQRYLYDNHRCLYKTEELV
jgi:hypothetical protein